MANNGRFIQIAFFGDSFCYDSKDNPHSHIYQHREHPIQGTQTETYIDYVSERLQLPVVNYGISGHGPTYTLSEMDDWFKKNIDDLPSTYIIICWSDYRRQLVKTWKNDTTSFGGATATGEQPLPGPDAPMLDEPKTPIDPRWAQAVKLYWAYLRNENEYKRHNTAIKYAFQYMKQVYNIQPDQLQQYECFGHSRSSLDDCSFFYDGKEFDSLFAFARYFDDYGVQGVDDLLYRNHLSDKGHFGMADVIQERYEKHVS